LGAWGKTGGGGWLRGGKRGGLGDGGREKGGWLSLSPLPGYYKWVTGEGSWGGWLGTGVWLLRPGGQRGRVCRISQVRPGLGPRPPEKREGRKKEWVQVRDRAHNELLP